MRTPGANLLEGPINSIQSPAVSLEKETSGWLYRWQKAAGTRVLTSETYVPFAVPC